MKANTPNPTPTTLRDLLEPILIKLYFNGRTDVTYEVTSGKLPLHAKSVKDQWLDQTAQSIQEQLKALLPKEVHQIIEDFCSGKGKE